MRALLRRLAVPLALLLAWAAPARSEEARVTVLHTTDLHGALTTYDYLADRPAPRGLTGIATLVKRVRAEGAPTLLLDAGDAIQGAGIEYVYQHGERALPEPMMTAMSAIGYDAMAVGNHEFSFGRDAARAAQKTASFPWLAANVVRDDGLPAFGTSLIKTLGTVRIGIVGLATPAVPAMEDSVNVAGLRFEPPVHAARLEVARLRQREHCDLVVVLAHTGLERDPKTGVERAGDTPDENWGYRLATEVPGADLVILGHTHAVVPALDLGGTLVTQAGKWGENLGRVDLTLARESAAAPWRLVRREARMIAVTDSVPDDSALAAFAAPYHQAAQAELSRAIGVATREIGSPRGRLENGPLWELIHRVQLEASGADVSLAALFDPVARIAAGVVTLRDVLRAYPYDNTLGMVELTGAQLEHTLEQSARCLAPYTYEADRPLFEPGWPLLNFDSASGVEYEVDLTRPPGDRISHLIFRGEPLAPERRLKVAVNSYRMNGGGGFEALRTAPRLWRSSRGMPELLADYVARQRALDGAFTRDWRILPAYASTPERPLIDRLVRQGVAPRNELLRLEAYEPARRGDLAYWLARAFGWRESRHSGAFADVPDSLEPWLDGLVRRKVLGEAATLDRFEPFRTASVWDALAWCEAAARRARYALDAAGGPAFRRGLMTGVGLDRDSLASGSLTLAQLLGMVSNLRYPTVRVLETTDFHGAILPGARDRGTRRPVGGSAVLAAWVERLRAENPEGTVLVDGGDWFQGTMISNLQFGRPVVEQMNALGYAAAVIGNHEFDWTADTLARRIGEMRFAALGANLFERRSGRRPRWARADTVIARRGVRVGILGLCYRETPTVTLAANVAHLRFDDDSLTAARRVPALRRRDHAAVLIAVGHIPAESDSTRHAVGGDLPRLAHVPGVDVWLGGHSHNQVVDEIGGAPVMIAGAHAELIGLCDLVVDPVRGRVIEHRQRLVPTFADELTPDSAMAARVQRWNAGVAPLAGVVIGRNARRLTRSGDATVGYLVTDAMRAASGADVALQNSGGLRADLAEGQITRGGIYEVMPFDNTIVTMELTGAELKRALEEGMRFGRVAQVSGLKVVFDLGRPALQRLVSITLADGSPLDDARPYKVAVNNFMATGGDSYETLTRGRNLTDTAVLVRDAMERLVRARCANGGTLDYSPEGRTRRADEREGGGGGR